MCGQLLEVQLRVRVSAQQVCCCAWCLLLALHGTPEHQRCSFFALSSIPTLLSITSPLCTMYVAASEDLDDLFDIVQRVRAQADVEGGPAGPHDDDCDLGKDVKQMETDAEVDLIPTTVLEVETKKQRRVKVSKVRMIHTFRADSIIKRQQVTGVMTHMCCRVCVCV